MALSKRRAISYNRARFAHFLQTFSRLRSVSSICRCCRPIRFPPFWTIFFVRVIRRVLGNLGSSTHLRRALPALSREFFRLLTGSSLTIFRSAPRIRMHGLHLVLTLLSIWLFPASEPRGRVPLDNAGIYTFLPWLFQRKRRFRHLWKSALDAMIASSRPFMGFCATPASRP
jgi:hypothetical protein